ncbi:MAG: hypothetical protein IKN41_01335 [Candidatus Methanomethylophilaceae archaeon]|nr:hypothetical protein [Candidatus Methanomethylophilaceae archaeon]
MENQSTLFDEMTGGSDTVVKNGLCNVCKGTRRLCGKDRCPLMVKFYTKKINMPVIKSNDVAGSSPPAVFVGRYGYPKVEIGPLLPTFMGDTTELDKPELWGGKSMYDIAAMRYQLVRGKYRIDATDFAKSGKIVDNVQELALTAKPVNVETYFEKKPSGRIVLDDEIMPFGPSGKMSSIRVENGRFEHNLEKSFYDTDMNSTDAVVAAYHNGTFVSEIEKAFSVGTMGVGKRRRFVPTRWSITAVDDIIGKNLMKDVRYNETIDEFRLFQWKGLDNWWSIVMMPVTWRYEMIEAWYPKTSWNPSPNEMVVAHDHEFFEGRTQYADNITGAYYAARLAVTEYLQSIGRSAGVMVFREVHPGYDIPLGVWNIRENVRAALRTQPYTAESLERLWPQINAFMDLKKERWLHNSEILKDYLIQRRIEDFY